MKIKYLGFIILGFLVVGLVTGGFILKYQYNKPLGPIMNLTTPVSLSKVTAETSPTAFLPAIPTATTVVVTTEVIAVATTEAPTPQPFCGQTGKMVVMVIGEGANPTIVPHRSDLVRYVQIDFDQRKVTIFTFPRDLWLNTPVLVDQKINSTTLGETYHYAMLAARAKATGQDDKKLITLASQAIAQTIYDNFGIKPDHYVTVKLGNLPKLIDAVGGVSIDNPTRLVTTYNPPFTFNVGVQTINGLQAASYVRFADATHTDWDRIARQNLVIHALYKKLEDPATLTKIPTFFTQLADSIVTDLSVEDATDMTCMLKFIEEDHIIQEKVHPDMVTPGQEDSSLIPDIYSITELLRSLELLP